MSKHEEQIIPIKISQLAEHVSQRKQISLEDALVYVYVNPMYRRLYDEDSKWWYLSTEALYDEFENARKNERKVIDKEVFEFYAYCIERYAIEKSMTGLQVVALFKKYEADDYLINHYDLLHTQGTSYVIDEIDRLIKERKRK